MAGFDSASEILQKNKGKKKKKYVLHLYNQRANEANVRTIERAVAAGLKEHTLLHLADPEEALKLLLIKHIDLLIVDPDFLGSDRLTVEYAAELKKRKKVPIFFISSNEEVLIREYQRLMFQFEELDDYAITPLDFIDVGKRLKKVITSPGRAAKRFNVGCKVNVFRMDLNEWFNATLADLSIVGFGLALDDQNSLRRGAQIVLKLPLFEFNFFHPQYGDYLRVAGKVQRVSIDGKTLGCSLEYLTQMQTECLTRILEVIARRKRIKNAKAASTQKLEEGQSQEQPAAQESSQGQAAASA